MADTPQPVTTYKKAKSGMYRVELSEAHPHAGFTYKPGAEAIVVNQEILDDMIAAGRVTSVAGA